MTSQISPKLDSREVVLVCGDRRIRGDLLIPDQPRAIVLFVHGTGSSRFSPQNRRVAEYLRSKGLGTFLMDLLDEDEAEDRNYVFDIPRLVQRLKAAESCLREDPELQTLPLGYFAASTGAAAALAVAAGDSPQVFAIVCRGGRPDLVWDLLPKVNIPTLLIVGGADSLVLELNRDSLDRLAGPKELAIIPNTTHLFTEPGALDQVASLAANWFLTHLETSPTNTKNLDQLKLAP